EKLSYRKQAWIEFLGLLCFGIPYLLVVGYFSWTFIMQAWESNEGSAAMTGLSHRWIIKSFVLIGLSLLMMAVISTILRQIFYLFGPAELRDRIPMPMLATDQPLP
ncbi:MAG: C4-dicarboxylate ABC transporter permease, partial [Candidatus Competibacteraceae bacterium]|nr:C4-dicarboxylate ABC transporter permease [Candidatus Competibacteraceae bacterium]